MFTGEVDCTYFFTWDTKYACVKEKESLLCSVTDGKRRYDLSALARHAGRPGPAPTRVSAVCSREPFRASPRHTFGNAPATSCSNVN